MISLMNRLGNAANPYQGPARRVLCVCSAGLLRSPTMANVLHKLYGYNTRAVGYAPDYALILLDEVLVAWADEIVLADKNVLAGINACYGHDKHFMAELNAKPVVVLNIPDAYGWNSDELVDAITEQYAYEE